MIETEAIIGLPGYELIAVEETSEGVRIRARLKDGASCPKCGSTDLRNRDRYTREVRHESRGLRRCTLQLECRKWKCKACGRVFRERFEGILPYQRASEPFRREVFRDHWDGISRSRLAARQGIGSATVERWFQHGLRRLAAERSSAACPRVLGIDEHFFTRRRGYATTLCNLEKHSVYDVVLGRSEASLASYLKALKGRDGVRIVCMDLSPTYRSIAATYFPNARIVADRFHVIRLVNHHFLACWKELDAVGAKNRGLLSLLRRHRRNLKPEQRKRLAGYFSQQPAVAVVWRFKEFLMGLLLKKQRTRRQCERLAPRLLQAIEALKSSGFAHLVRLGETLESWAEEVARMWRFTRNNGITEGFHTKMEVLQRQAYGFRNFSNYRLRVRVMCC